MDCGFLNQDQPDKQPHCCTISCALVVADATKPTVVMGAVVEG